MHTPVRKGSIPLAKHDLQSKPRLKLIFREEGLADEAKGAPPWSTESLLSPARVKSEANNRNTKKSTQNANSKTTPV